MRTGSYGFESVIACLYVCFRISSVRSLAVVRRLPKDFRQLSEQESTEAVISLNIFFHKSSLLISSVYIYLHVNIMRSLS
jgi:hypothetical protein